MKRIKPIDIAKKLNISTSSLRSYEERGIVPKPSRSSAGYRIYTEEHLAYFDCIIAMSPGFGMDITSAVLKALQRKELDDALWLINSVQVAAFEDKILIEQVNKHLEHLTFEKAMTIGEVELQTNIPSSTLRYWEKEGYIKSKRGNNNYRYFNSYQFLKVLLMKFTQNAVYSHDVVQLKKYIRNLEEYNVEGVKSIIDECQKLLNKRNHEQLHGLYYLNRLCSKLGLI
ncbi:MerR family transcriptional regulator [Cytobacillus oceanisediminis]|uniref:MerR family transcriptional regulator n=1 Tax=Cytobacillus oceanisediminis TaxID=665099 RepID=UPI001C23627F|nr:MerR family DNA-binding transcriptional regulator [Cytobacillus oceanisediminis]MBU8733517.1 MerR family DNA-binding transcriptional regulator [Cytobacillus oceanisediminis]MBY0155675.1 MerR family DNA-binding transcriptional regulator [Cytobacillus firmus]USK42205.1 MerR family DNA-binding transcriptional regulator [Cytobacillus oceanisediminis]